MKNIILSNKWLAFFIFFSIGIIIIIFQFFFDKISYFEEEMKDLEKVINNLRFDILYLSDMKKYKDTKKGDDKDK